MKFLNVSKAVCHPDNPESEQFDIIVIVWSLITDFYNRMRYRQLYSNITNQQAKPINDMKIGLVFFVGMPSTRINPIYKHSGFDFNLLDGYGGLADAQAVRKVTNQLQEEIVQHDDVIVGDFEDTFFNDTMKKHYSFVWASTFCRKSKPTILFLGSGDAFKSNRLTDILSAMPTRKRESLLHGTLSSLDNEFISRGMPRVNWAVSKEEVAFPTYPPYISGADMLVGFKSLQHITLGMYFTKLFHTADAWVTITAIRSRLHVQRFNDITNYKNHYIYSLP